MLPTMKSKQYVLPQLRDCYFWTSKTVHGSALSEEVVLIVGASSVRSLIVKCASVKLQ
jgi:hypothetical protein